ncbi:MAG: histidine--tRNA ligase [Thermodesulfobacteriota bacterium]
MVLSIQAIRGFKDVLPEEAVWWRRVEDQAALVLDRFGYRNLRLPVVEKTELFARGIGTDTDIVEKEMYTFPDRHGEFLTLRPEATAGIVRCLLEHNLAADGRPVKLWVLGPMFRYERPQKGRQRQFHQLDVEVFNDPSPHADAEIIVLLDHFLSTLGLADVVMNVNSLGCPGCRPAYREALRSFLAGRREELCPDCQRRMETNPLRVIDCKVPRCAQIAAGAPMILDFLCPACREHFAQVQEDLAAAKVRYEVNPRLVRGLDYYTRTTFEALTGELGAQNAVAGGGRYDHLAETLGGPSIPATGWAMGLERLVMLLAGRGSPPEAGCDLFVAALDEEAVRAGFALVQDLRRQGFSVEMDYAPGSLKSRLRRADKIGARRVLILGQEERAKGEAILRDMRAKDQKAVPLAQAATLIRNELEMDQRVHSGK